MPKTKKSGKPKQSGKPKKSAKPQFEEVEYDVSINMMCWIACCPLTFGAIPYKTLLFLGSEEVKKTDVSICGKSEANMPYGELGHVGKSNCLCCTGFSASFGEIQPGCGCDEELVDKVVKDLKQRQEGRGDQGQIQRQEAMGEEIELINNKLDAIMEHLKIEKMERGGEVSA